MSELEIDGNDYMNYFIDNGIMHCEFKKAVVVDMDVAKALVKARLDKCEGKDYPTIFNYDNFNYAGKNVRDYMNKEGLAGMTAGAIFTESFAIKTFFNFFLACSKPEIPAKVFTDKVKALNWLSKHVE